MKSSILLVATLLLSIPSQAAQISGNAIPCRVTYQPSNTVPQYGTQGAVSVEMHSAPGCQSSTLLYVLTFASTFASVDSANTKYLYTGYELPELYALLQESAWLGQWVKWTGYDAGAGATLRYQGWTLTFAPNSTFP